MSHWCGFLNNHQMLAWSELGVGGTILDLRWYPDHILFIIGFTTVKTSDQEGTHSSSSTILPATTFIDFGDFPAIHVCGERREEVLKNSWSPIFGLRKRIFWKWCRIPILLVPVWIPCKWRKFLNPRFAVQPEAFAQEGWFNSRDAGVNTQNIKLYLYGYGENMGFRRMMWEIMGIPFDFVG